MKRRMQLAACLILGVTLTTFSKQQKFTLPPSDRIKTNIDFDWKFINRDFPAEEETHQVNQLPWQTVNLPHDWTIDGSFDKEHNATQGFLPMGIGWYNKSLFFPESYSGKKIFIIFDGVYRSCDVWLNYAHLGHHESGYTSFIHDITDYVRLGDAIPNGLRVRVDGRRHEEDMYEGNGIYRHVWLLVTNRLHIPYWSTFVSTPEISEEKATVQVLTKIKNDNDLEKQCKLTTAIVDAGGNVAGEISSIQSIPPRADLEFVQKIQLPNPHLWDVDDPYLYKACSILQEGETPVDSCETPFGIRSFHFDPNSGYFLNGKHIKLKGFNAHHDFAGLGTALPDRIHWNAMAAMKMAGFNFYRSSHNPATPERLDVCDRLGLLVWDEIERKLESPEIELPLVRDTIIRDRSHPSVILWSLENESPLESTVYGTRIIKAATELAHQLDPTRPTTFAASMPVNKNGYGDAVDVVSYNYHWKRADEDHINFPRWKIGCLSEFSAARARRGVYGVERFARAEEDSYFDLYSGMVQTMYEMCSRVEEYWQRIKAREYLGGGCLWSGMDYWGEGNAWPLISRGDGALDMCLFPKDVYYYFVSQWTDRPMAHILPHWNWEDKKSQPIDVWCYSNCDSVELFLNGRSLGIRKRPPEPAPWSARGNNSLPPETVETYPEHMAWQVPYEPGTLRVVGRRRGSEACSSEIRTAGKPFRVELRPAMTEFVAEEKIPPLTADGRDIAVIKAAVLDKNGNLVPTADNLVTFSVAGEGKLIAVGNGNIASHEPNKAAYRRAYNGLCAAIVQGTTKAGEIAITATSPGLSPGKITITSTFPNPAEIAVDTNPFPLSPGTEESVVTAEIRDRFGALIPSATHLVTFRLDGPAVFQNGARSLEVHAAGGKAAAKIKASNEPGKVTVAAYCEGMLPGKLDVKVAK